MNSDEDTNAPRRRSGRAGRPNKKYVVDPFEQYRELLNQDSDTSRAPSVREPAEPSDDEFDMAAAAAEEAQNDAEDDDDAGSDSGASEGGMFVSAKTRRPAAAVEEPDDDEPVITTKRPKVKLPAMNRTTSIKGKSLNKKRMENFSYSSLPIFDPLGNTGAKGRNIHFTRGVPEATHTQGRSERLIYSIGPGEEDLIAYIEARERWLDDATVPHRKQTPKGKPGGGLSHSPFYPEAKRQREANEEMSWYYEECGREMFASQQNVSQVDENFAPNNYSECDDIIAGSIDAQKHLEGHQFGVAWNMGEAYADAETGEKQQAWTLNAGARIQALEWCPNQQQSSQYLAVATSFSPSDAQYEEDVIAPAFTPLPRRQQCLQIWEVQARGGSESEGSGIGFTKPPLLRQMISSDWGHVKKMRWCPIPDREDEGRRRLGLLAIVFTDGRLRLFDLAIPDDHHMGIEYLHLEKAAFESKPFETLATCLTWLSSKSIAAGTADGSVAIWTIPDSLKESSKSQSKQGANAHPWMYQRLHQGYIQSITCGYPSRPHLLITHSFDGFLRLTDLRSPNLDTVVSQRSRIAQGPVVWHDITQSALNVDDNFTMKSYGARMFYKAISVARLTAFGADVSVSPLHASVLTGCVDGTAWVTNPMRRLRDHKYRPLVQCVLKHEWRRPVKPHRTTRVEEGDNGDQESSNVQEDVMDVDPNPIFAKPLIRLLTGFKIQISDMGQEGRLNATKDFISFATVHEERTAVTQVAWNPNLIAGTWAAIGMASGLVVIKDLAYE